MSNLLLSLGLYYDELYKLMLREYHRKRGEHKDKKAALNMALASIARAIPGASKNDVIKFISKGKGFNAIASQIDN